MARPKKSKTNIPSNIVEAQRKLDTLLDEKYSLLRDLSNIHNEFNSLSDKDAKSPDDWLYGLPIETASALNEKNRMTRLKKVRVRKGLRKDSSKVLDQIDRLETEIRIAYLDLLTEKVTSALGDNA